MVTSSVGLPAGSAARGAARWGSEGSWFGVNGRRVEAGGLRAATELDLDRRPDYSFKDIYIPAFPLYARAHMVFSRSVDVGDMIEYRILESIHLVIMFKNVLPVL